MSTELSLPQPPRDDLWMVVRDGAEDESRIVVASTMEAIGGFIKDDESDTANAIVQRHNTEQGKFIEKEAGYVRLLQRNSSDLKKKDTDRETAKTFLETIRNATPTGTKEYQDVDRIIQVLRTI